MQLVFVLSLAGAAIAPEPAPPVSLRWTAPPECPDEQAVLQQVERALGGPPPASARVRADVTVRRDSSGLFSLDLEIRSEGHTGRRHLEGERCDALADAAALIVAVAIDPRVLEREIQPEPEPAEPKPAPEPEGIVPAPASEVPRAPETETETETETPDASVAEPVAEPRSGTDRPPTRIHVGLSALAGPGFVILPDPTAVVALAANVSGRLWRTELGITYWVPRDQQSRTNPAVGGRFQLWSVGARGCVEPAVPVVTFPICVGLEVGAMHGLGRGALEPLASSAPWVAATGGLGLVVRPRMVRGRLGFVVRGEGLAALARPRFSTEPSGLVYRAPAGGAQVLAGIEVRLR